MDCSTLSSLKPILDFVQNIINLIKIAVPILLIVMGSLDLGKAVMAGKEDEIKKSQSTFIKRAIAAVMVFFVSTIVGLLGELLVDQGFKNCLETGYLSPEDNSVIATNASMPSDEIAIMYDLTTIHK